MCSSDLIGLGYQASLANVNLKSGKLVFGIEGITDKLVEINAGNVNQIHMISFNKGDLPEMANTNATTGSRNIRLFVTAIIGTFKLNDLSLCLKPVPTEASCANNLTNYVKNSSFLTNVDNWLGYNQSAGTYYNLSTNSWSSESLGIILDRAGVEANGTAVEIRQKITGINPNSSLFLSFDVPYYSDEPEAFIEYGAYIGIMQDNGSSMIFHFVFYSNDGRNGGKKPTSIKESLSTARTDGTCELYFKLGTRSGRAHV